MPKGEKYFNSFDRVFLALKTENGEYPKVKFRDMDGKEMDGSLSGASITVAVLWVDAVTGQPVYSVNSSDNECVESHDPGDRWFRATIDRELGVLIIPDYKEMGVLQKGKHLESQQDLRLACKIDSYSVEIWTSECMCDSFCVKESEFQRIVQENFDSFNNSDNYSAQNTAYLYNPVAKEYPRKTWYAGYDYSGKPIAVEAHERNKIKAFFSASSTEERAIEYAKKLGKITPEELKEIIFGDKREKRAIDAINELIKEKESAAAGV